MKHLCLSVFKILLCLAALQLWNLATAPPAAAQTGTQVTATWKTQQGLTPSGAGLKQLATIGATAVYGRVDFVAVDTARNAVREITCGGVTYGPQNVRGWIRGDGVMIDSAGNAYVRLIPTVGCTPSGLAYRATIFFNVSTDGRLAPTTFIQDKAIPDQASVDWASLAPAAAQSANTPLQTQLAGAVLNYESWTRFAAASVPAAAAGVDNIFIDSADAQLKAKDSAGAVRVLALSSITAREVDGAPSVAATVIEFNQAVGLIVTDQTGGVARVSLSAVPDSALAQISTAGKVSGAALTSLSSIPSGAGIIPAANLPASNPYTLNALTGDSQTFSTPNTDANLEIVLTSSVLNHSFLASWKSGSTLAAARGGFGGTFDTTGAANLSYPCVNAVGPPMTWQMCVLSQEVRDNTFRITDDVDATKKLAFEVSAIPASTTRTWTLTSAGELQDAAIADNITLTNITQITNRALVDLTASGLTVGQVPRATGAATFAWQQLSFSDITGSVTDAQVPDTITVSNYLPLAGGTMTGTLTVRAGATGAGTAPVKFQAGSVMTSPEAHAFEWDGTNLFVTQSTGPTRKTLAFTDSNITGNAATATALAADPSDCATNQFANAIAASGNLTCAGLTLASAQFANQGTTTTVLHGNAAGNPSWAAVNLSTTVTGTLPIGSGGTNATTAAAARSNLGVRWGAFYGSNAANYSPTDGSTSYFGTNAQFSTEQNDTEVLMPFAMTIERFCVRVRVQATLGSNENVTINIRKNRATDSSTLTMTWDAADPPTACASLSGFTVAQDDRLSLKVVHPTWATNPTNVRVFWSITALLDQ
jgi:hypothetical protein